MKKDNITKTLIWFNDMDYILEKFHYVSGRNGIMLTEFISGKNQLAATLDIKNVRMNEKEVIIKSHGLNKGLLECLIEHEIIEKPSKEVTLGFNMVYICSLKI